MPPSSALNTPASGLTMPPVFRRGSSCPDSSGRNVTGPRLDATTRGDSIARRIGGGCILRVSHGSRDRVWPFDLPCPFEADILDGCVTGGEAVAQRDRVVILGGGFAGVGAARKLKGVDAEVVLIDRHDYHTFSPMLYQVATDLVDPATVGHPLRDLFDEQPNVIVHQTTATAVDLAAKRVSFEDMAPITYDYLVLGLGAVVNFFGVPGAPEHAFPSTRCRTRCA